MLPAGRVMAEGRSYQGQEQGPEKPECVQKRVKHTVCKEYMGKGECVQRTGKHVCVQRTDTLLRAGKEFLCLGPWVTIVQPGCVSALGSVSPGKLRKA